MEYEARDRKTERDGGRHGMEKLRGKGEGKMKRRRGGGREGERDLIKGGRGRGGTGMQGGRGRERKIEETWEGNK